MLDHIVLDDFAQFQFRLLLERLPDALRREFAEPERFMVGEVHQPEYNSEVALAENGGALVFISTGLMAFTYKISRLLATRMVAVDSSGISIESPQVDFNNLCGIAATMFAWLDKTGIAFGPDFPISGRQLVMAHTMATHAEWFVFCHEIGHVLLGHLENTAETRLVDGIELLKRNQEEEFEADIKGFDVLQSAIATEHTSSGEEAHRGMAWVGALLFLCVDAMFNNYAQKKPSTTHPPSSDRIKRLRINIREGCSGEAEFRRIDQRAAALEMFLKSIEARLEIKPRKPS
jgi:hypothetical protein